MDPAEIEREVDAALRRLPALRAPATLTPRVMAAVRQRREAPWYRRSWFAWPAGGRLVAATVALALIGAGVWWMPSAVQVTAQAATSSVASLGQYVTWQPPDSVRRVLEVAGAVQAVWRALLGPLVSYAAGFAVVMGGVFALCAAVLTRVTLGRAPA
jgi:hypothetical protein